MTEQVKPGQDEQTDLTQEECDMVVDSIRTWIEAPGPKNSDEIASAQDMIGTYLDAGLLDETYAGELLLAIKSLPVKE